MHRLYFRVLNGVQPSLVASQSNKFGVVDGNDVDSFSSGAKDPKKKKRKKLKNARAKISRIKRMEMW